MNSFCFSFKKVDVDSEVNDNNSGKMRTESTTESLFSAARALTILSLFCGLVSMVFFVESRVTGGTEGGVCKL